MPDSATLCCSAPLAYNPEDDLCPASWYCTKCGEVVPDPPADTAPREGANVAAFHAKAEGWRFTASFEVLWSEGELHYQKYTYGGAIEQHGYRNRGSWALIGGEGWTPSHRVKARRYREKRWRWLVIDEVVAIQEGWRRGKTASHGLGPL